MNIKRSGFYPAAQDEAALLAIHLLVPSAGEAEPEFRDSLRFRKSLKDIGRRLVNGVEHPRASHWTVLGFEDVAPDGQGLLVDRLDARPVRSTIPATLVLEARLGE